MKVFQLEKIRNLYYSAGAKYGWQGAGISLSLSHFKRQVDVYDVEVVSEKKYYSISKEKALLLDKIYYARRKAHSGDILMVLPANEFDVRGLDEKL